MKISFISGTSDLSRFFINFGVVNLLEIGRNWEDFGNWKDLGWNFEKISDEIRKISEASDSHVQIRLRHVELGRGKLVSTRKRMASGIEPRILVNSSLTP